MIYLPFTSILLSLPLFTSPISSTTSFLLFQLVFTCASPIVSLNHLRFLTDKSELRIGFPNIHFDFDSIEDFQDFVNKVRCNVSFEESKLAFNDLSYFASELFGLNKTISLKGEAKGTVARFKAKRMNIAYGPGMYFNGDVNMNGLPDFDNTYMEISVNDLCLNKKDIETIPQWPFETSEKISLPNNLSVLGLVHFKGKFNGFYNDFVAYGNTNSEIGYISSDINLKIAPNDKNTTYSGNLSLFDFDMGKLLKLNPDLGKVSMKANIKGRGFELVNLILV